MHLNTTIITPKFNKIMKNLVIIILVSISSLLNAQIESKFVEELKNSTVQILIDGNPVGTGFFVSEIGQIITNFHVIASLRKDSTTGAILNKLEILTREKKRYNVHLYTYYIKEGLKESQLYDYCLLQAVGTKDSLKFPFLKLGNYNDLIEGQEIITCGYPLGIEEQFVSKGMISTKWKRRQDYWELKPETGEKIITDSIYQDVAYLDMTTNKGNSGGAIVMINERQELLVIGIASFIITPNGKQSEKLLEKIKYLKSIKMQFSVGIDVFDELYNLALATSQNSVGISGLISIEHFKKTFKN
jgi:serine protease Do